ncbi:MAG: endonuclease [Prevotella sp.]|nr:endonuclease [Prevotella sp.]
MTTKKLLTAVTLLCLSLAIGFAQGPNGSKTYYKKANGKKGAELKTELCGIIYDRTSERSYKQLWEDFKETDKRSDGKVWDMYSGITNYTFGTDQAGSYTEEGDVYNREHSFPKSWFGDNAPMYTDLFHLYPTDGFVNGKRSNHPFGETNSPTYSSVGGFSKLGPCSYPGYTGTVFEPNDLYKGDFARTYFYMVTCYEEKIVDWYTNYGVKITDNNNETKKAVMATLDGKKYPGLSSWQLSMLMKWAKNDQVSAKERARNIAVAGIQGNRNPFIDYPGLEEYIWGEWQDVEFSYDNYVSPYGGETPTTVSTPYFSPAGGTYTTEQTVTISCATSGATIYYTTNGSKPSTSSTMYNGAITISETTTLKAIAIKDGTESSVAEATYTINTGGGEPVTVKYEATFNFPEENYGMTALSGNTKDYNPNPTTITSDGVSLTMAGDNSSRYWSTNNTYELRVYKACTMTISAPDNGKITKIVFTGSTISDILNNGKSLSNGTWTGKESSVVFTFNENQRINTIKITYEVEATEPEVLLGDVNNDGAVTIADVTALVNVLLGKGSSYNLDAADVNSDDKTTIADVVALVKMILTK